MRASCGRLRENAHGSNGDWTKSDEHRGSTLPGCKYPDKSTISERISQNPGEAFGNPACASCCSMPVMYYSSSRSEHFYSVTRYSAGRRVSRHTQGDSTSRCVDGWRSWSLKQSCHISSGLAPAKLVSTHLPALKVWAPPYRLQLYQAPSLISKPLSPRLFTSSPSFNTFIFIRSLIGQSIFKPHSLSPSWQTHSLQYFGQSLSKAL